MIIALAVALAVESMALGVAIACWHDYKKRWRRSVDHVVNLKRTIISLGYSRGGEDLRRAMAKAKEVGVEGVDVVAIEDPDDIDWGRS